jgi:hypothetical protein
MTPFEIPLSPQAQVMTITLAGIAYQVAIHWCAPMQAWVADFADTSENPILQGVPIVTGTDLLDQFAYLNFGGELIAQTDHAVDAVPTFANLGSNGHLYFVTP